MGTDVVEQTCQNLHSATVSSTYQWCDLGQSSSSKSLSPRGMGWGGVSYHLLESLSDERKWCTPSTRHSDTQGALRECLFFFFKCRPLCHRSHSLYTSGVIPSDAKVNRLWEARNKEPLFSQVLRSHESTDANTVGVRAWEALHGAAMQPVQFTLQSWGSFSFLSLFKKKKKIQRLYHRNAL